MFAKKIAVSSNNLGLVSSPEFHFTPVYIPLNVTPAAYLGDSPEHSRPIDVDKLVGLQSLLKTLYGN